VTVVALVGQSIPSFWLGILLILLLGVDLKWLPISGSGSWQHFIMPGITLSAFSIARNMRLTRSSMLDYMQKDFVRTARSKGLPEGRVIYGHVLRNSLLPIVTAIGLEIGFLLGGSVIVETIFGWPGVGREIVAAIGSKDFYVVQAGVIMLALIFAGVNLIIDLVYMWIDPRIRYGN
jgi:peptide/nickel transport system permease protein